MLKYKMKCLKCGKRAFDISGLPTVPLIVELKCPNCHNIVKIPCDKNHCTEQRNS